MGKNITWGKRCPKGLLSQHRTSGPLAVSCTGLDMLDNLTEDALAQLPMTFWEMTWENPALRGDIYYELAHLPPPQHVT